MASGTYRLLSEGTSGTGIQAAVPPAGPRSGCGLATQSVHQGGGRCLTKSHMEHAGDDDPDAIRRECFEEGQNITEPIPLGDGLDIHPVFEAHRQASRACCGIEEKNAATHLVGALRMRRGQREDSAILRPRRKARLRQAGPHQSVAGAVGVDPRQLNTLRNQRTGVVARLSDRFARIEQTR